MSWMARLISLAKMRSQNESAAPVRNWPLFLIDSCSDAQRQYTTQ